MAQEGKNRFDLCTYVFVRVEPFDDMQGKLCGEFVRRRRIVMKANRFGEQLPSFSANESCNNVPLETEVNRAEIAGKKRR